MNDTEFLLLKEAFRNVLKDEIPKLIKEELENYKKTSAKDLKEIKLLVAKIITEARKRNDIGDGQLLTDNTKNRLGEVFNRANKYPKTPLENKVQQGLTGIVAPAPLKNILLETAGEMSRGESNAQDLGIGEYSDDPRWASAPEQESQQYDYGEIEEYESNIPDFEQALAKKFNK